jgi:hypothetical protein
MKMGSVADPVKETFGDNGDTRAVTSPAPASAGDAVKVAAIDANARTVMRRAS